MIYNYIKIQHREQTLANRTDGSAGRLGLAFSLERTPDRLPRFRLLSRHLGGWVKRHHVGEALLFCLCNPILWTNFQMNGLWFCLCQITHVLELAPSGYDYIEISLNTVRPVPSYLDWLETMAVGDVHNPRKPVEADRCAAVRGQFDHWSSQSSCWNWATCWSSYINIFSKATYNKYHTFVQRVK